eukprot:PLAT8885.1.p1 GENE.PLAT8885.1~~PLAT8885.1.p1  ORF type:complete len:314 (-),score=141.31 PLAT8885.1:161-1102(-)
MLRGSACRTASSAVRAALCSADLPVPRLSASVLVLREAADGRDGGSHDYEVLLAKRGGGAKFMAQSWVFPGGVVEEADGDLSLWPALADAAGGDALQRQLRLAAVREVYEETGLLLVEGAGMGSDSAAAAAGEDMQAAVAKDAALFASLLADSGCTPAVDALLPVANFITPVVERYRYDTHFYLALLPHKQETRLDKTEMDAFCWLAPGDALARCESGRMQLPPPQFYLLSKLLPFTQLETVVKEVAAWPAPQAWLPCIVADDDGVHVLLPGDEEHPDSAGAAGARHRVDILPPAEEGGNRRYKLQDSPASRL